MAQVNYKIGLSTQDKANMAASIRAMVLDVSRKTYGVRFYGNAVNGTRLEDAVGKTANISYDNGLSVVNDFDDEPIFSNIRKIVTPARDVNGDVLTDNGGNVINTSLIYIPNFYFKIASGEDSNGAYVDFLVTTSPKEGYAAMFKNIDGSPKKYALTGAYYTTVLKDKATTILGCQAGQKPRVNIDIRTVNDYMTYIAIPELNLPLTRLVGAENMSIWVARSILMTIEFATRNHQSIFNGVRGESWTNLLSATLLPYNNNTGANKSTTTLVLESTSSAIDGTTTVGSVVHIYSPIDSTATWVTRTITAITADTPSAGFTTIEIDTPITLSASSATTICKSSGDFVGSTDNLPTFSGIKGASNGSVNHFKYRGVEDAYGNIYSTLGGFAVKGVFADGVAKNTVIQQGEGDTLTTLSTWDDIANSELPLVDGYVTAIGVSLAAGIFWTKAAGGDGASDKYYCDYYYQTHRTTDGTSYYEFLAGGRGNNCAYVGSFCFYCNSAWGNTNYNFGLRPSLIV